MLWMEYGRGAFEQLRPACQVVPDHHHHHHHRLHHHHHDHHHHHFHVHLFSSACLPTVSMKQVTSRFTLKPLSLIRSAWFSNQNFAIIFKLKLKSSTNLVGLHSFAAFARPGWSCLQTGVGQEKTLDRQLRQHCHLISICFYFDLTSTIKQACLR